MAESATPSLLNLSRDLAQLIETAAPGVVAVAGARRHGTSAIHWRSGILVTAEEALEQDEDIQVTLPDGRRVAATLVGRDPSTDVAVLRFTPDGLPVVTTGNASTLRPGHLVVAIGRHADGAVASLGIAGFVGGAWQSQRGGTIDQYLRLDLTLSPTAEGGALVDAAGTVLGMTVLGPRRRALAIPASTIDRAVDQLLAKGHVARGYLGAGLRPVRLDHEGGKAGVLVVSIDPKGPAAGAGLLVGDVVTAWDGAPVGLVREVMRRLGTDSVGRRVDLAVLRGGQPMVLGITLGERPLT
jgi:S1-C subfamily serine protease